MKLKIEFNNCESAEIQESFLLKALKGTLARLGEECVFLKNKVLSVSLAAVSESEIKKLNKKYRGTDSLTDVLSFPEYPSKKNLRNAVDKEVFLGEIILCYNYIAEYAKKNREDIQTELARVVSHGLLHLLGFSHGEKMFGIQEEVAEKIEKL